MVDLWKYREVSRRDLCFSYIQPQDKIFQTANHRFIAGFNTIPQDPRPKELGLDNQLHAQILRNMTPVTRMHKSRVNGTGILENGNMPLSHLCRCSEPIALMLNAHQKPRPSRKGPTGIFATCKGVETDMSRSGHPEIL
jgi:hypothetical protein